MVMSDSGPPKNPLTLSVKLPGDLAVVILLSVLSTIVFLVPLVESVLLRVILAVPFMIFLPGYAIVAAFFPRHAETRTERPDQSEPSSESSVTLDRSITTLERITLSVGVSIVVVPLAGLVLEMVLPRLEPVSISLSVAGITTTAAIVAAGRRSALPKRERFRVPYGYWIDSIKDSGGTAEALANLFVVLGLVLLVSSFAYAATVPMHEFTEFYLLSEDESGNLTAADYPREFTQGESKQLYVGISNHERERVDYTVVVTLQRVSGEDSRILAENELTRFELDVANGDTRQEPHSVTPTMSGDRLRLVYLLYSQTPPSDPTVDNAYRHLHIWINVSV